MEENINIQDFQDFDNVTIAEFKVAIDNTEKNFYNCIKNKDMKGALNAFKLYAKLNKLLNKKTSLGSKYGYNSKGKK